MIKINTKYFNNKSDFLSSISAYTIIKKNSWKDLNLFFSNVIKCNNKTGIYRPHSNKNICFYFINWDNVLNCELVTNKNKEIHLSGTQQTLIKEYFESSHSLKNYRLNHIDNIKYKLPLIGLLVIATTMVNAQKTVSGIISNKENKPLEYILVVLKKDSSIVSNCFSDSVGHYKVYADISGSYEILYSYFNTNIVQNIKIKNDTIINLDFVEEENLLSEFKVTSRLPIIERKIDRIVFNPNNLISTAGTSAYETLKKAPSVLADESGQISIRGMSGAGVMINGRLLRLSNEQTMDYLNSIASDEIFKIEIITNPSSKYDAEGLSGLINIILKKNKKIGLNGNNTTYFEQTRYAKYGANIDLNYRSAKLNIFGGANLRKGEYFQADNVDNIFNRESFPYFYYENGNKKRNHLSNLNKLGIDYSINENNLIGLRIEQSYFSKKGTQVNYSTFQNNNLFVDSLYDTNIALENVTNDFNLNVNYSSTLDTSGQSITFDIDYSYFYQPILSTNTTTNRYNSLNQRLGENIVFKNEAVQKINIFAGKVDYSTQLLNTVWLEIGSKYYKLETNNDLRFYNYIDENYTLDNSKSLAFNYNESNLAFYANAYKQINDKWSIQIGARNETTFLEGSSTNDSTIKLKPNYNRFFPSIFIQFNKNENNQFGLNYTQRINRPGYSNLNPFRYYTNPNSYIEGNPFLQPAITNSIDLSYTINQLYFINAFMYLTNGQITQVTELNNSDNSYKFLSVNIDQSYNTGINTYLPFQIKNWWSSSLSFTLGFNGVKSIINNSPYVYNNFNFQIITNNQFTISEKGKMYGELNFLYQPSGSTQGLFVLGKLADLSLGIKKSFADNRFVLSVNVSDIFNAAYITATVNKSDQYSFINGNYDRRGIRFALSYKFGKNTIDKPRDKKPGIEDETKRIKL